MSKILLSLVFCFPILAVAVTTASSISIFEKPLSFEDEQGAKTSLSQWKGEDLIIAFAYTTCRSTCPLVMRQLGKIQNLMDEKSIKGEILFVTIDPENDTVARLARYKRDQKITSARWHFLHGSEDDTKALAAMLGFGYSFSDEHIWHDRKVMVIGKDGHLRTILDGWDADLSKLF